MTTKTTTTAKTTTTMSAAEARALAEQLTTAERDLADRKREARKAAQVATCVAELDGPDRILADAYTAAQAAWDAAVPDESVGLAELFALYQAMALSSAARAAHVATASGHWGNLEPAFHETSGQSVGHRGDTHDTFMAAGATFERAVEGVIASRVAAHRGRVEAEVHGRIRAAGDAAAEAQQ